MLAAVAKPTIDWAGTSPLLALLGGAIVVLLAGLLRGRFIREQAVPFLTIVAFAATIGLGIWQWGEGKDLFVAKGSQGALRLDELTLMIIFIVSRDRDRRGAAVLAGAGAARGRPRRVLRADADQRRGHGHPGRGPEPRDGVPGARAAVGPAVCAVRDRDAPRALAGVRA